MTDNKIGNLERMCWIVSIVLLVATVIADMLWCNGFKSLSSVYTITYNITASSISALTILYFQRRDRIKVLKRIYVIEISGTYYREKIFEPDSNHNAQLTSKNVNVKVEISHLSGHLVKVQTKYWGEQVQGIIEFSENSQFVGNGILRYLDNSTINIGTYKIQRFPDQDNVLYVYYENTIPRNGAIGYEIWRK